MTPVQDVSPLQQPHDDAEAEAIADA